MKILFSADHHHHPFTAFSTLQANGVSSRLAEGLAVEDHLAHLDADLHVRLGDLFHKKDALDAVTHAEVYQRLWEEAKRRPATAILRGNHDDAAGGLRSSLEALHCLPTLHVFSGQEITPFQVAENVAMAFLPHVRDPVSALQAFVWDAAGRQSAYRILCAHVAIRGAQTGSEFLLPGSVSLGDLLQAPGAFTHIMCGHYHEPQLLHAEPYIAYVGSLLQRSFADCGRPRRVLRLDTTTGLIEHLPTPGPSFRVVPVRHIGELEQPPPPEWSDSYLHVCTQDPRITADVIEKSGWHGKNFVVSQHTRTDASPLVSPAPLGRTSWGERFVQWTRDTPSSIPAEELLCHGRSLLAKASLS